MNLRKWSAVSLLAALPVLAIAADREIILTNIDVRGLERISTGAVFSNLPVDVGSRFDPQRSEEIVRALYRSGLFEDVSVGLDGQVLVIQVTERPAIANISFEGNEDVETDKLEEALNSAGIAKGRVFNRSVLEDLERELRQQYFARGKYNVKIDTSITPLDNNRVDIDIKIAEGVVSKIKQVNVVGNRDFADREILTDFNSGVPSWWAVFSSKDEYSKQKLAGDLETLRSHYLDKGYLNFNIDSTQVTITPDYRDIYVNINVTEGKKYTVSNVKLGGELLVPEEALRKLVKINAGDTFSRARVVETVGAMRDRLGEEGYAFAKIDVVPEIDEAASSVALNLVVEPGRRVYVRRINFRGNAKTVDEVFRREMRQLEGAWYSTTDVNRSKTRLQRLPYVEAVNLEQKRVPGEDDQVDLDITITERFSGSFSVGAGYSQNQGFLFNMSLQQDNAFGTGKRLALDFNNSSVTRIYSLSYTNPYYTLDGISRGFNAFYRTTDAAEADISAYVADRWGLSVRYGIPLTEFDAFNFSLGYENTEISTTSQTPTEILDFLQQNGDSYGEYVINAGLTHDTRDRTVFATKGNLQRLNLEAALPGSDLDYFKLSYRNQLLVPLTGRFVLSAMADVAYGDKLRDTSDLPFFEKFYAGGISSVRGYRTNSLGPLSSTADPFGGNFRTVANLELLFPAPFAIDNPSVRMGLFVDAGNVFATTDDFETEELRSSAGVSFEWLSPIGPLVFSYAKPLNDKPGDERQDFQFSIGAQF
ncbi:MAG: outer membrane protein assembly factor BamA [Thiotrichales bacterium]